GADSGPDLLAQPVTENDGVGGAIERRKRTLAHLIDEIGNARLAMRIDPEDARAHVARGIANDPLHLDRRRDRAGHPAFQRRHGRQRVLDSAPLGFRRQTVDARGCVFGFRGLHGRIAPLIRHRDMRQCVDQLSDEIVLRALHQGRHHDREANPDRHAENGYQRLPRPAAHMRPGDVKNQRHCTAPALLVTRTRRPSVSVVGAGEATRSFVARPESTSTARVPRMPISTSRLCTRSPSTTKTLVPCTASAGMSSASAFSRVTTLASTLMPGRSGVSSGSATLMRYVLAPGAPMGVISRTLPARRRPRNASVRSSTIWPIATRGMSSSFTSATICNGLSTPIRNRIWPASTTSPTSPSRRSTTPSI